MSMQGMMCTARKYMTWQGSTRACAGPDLMATASSVPLVMHTWNNCLKTVKNMSGIQLFIDPFTAQNRANMYQCFFKTAIAFRNLSLYVIQQFLFYIFIYLFILFFPQKVWHHINAVRHILEVFGLTLSQNSDYRDRVFVVFLRPSRMVSWFGPQTFLYNSFSFNLFNERLSFFIIKDYSLLYIFSSDSVIWQLRAKTAQQSWDSRSSLSRISMTQ